MRWSPNWTEATLFENKEGRRVYAWEAADVEYYQDQDQDWTEKRKVTYDTILDRPVKWAELKSAELEAKGRENWDVDDYEAYYYCEECFAEDQAEAEYLGDYSIIY